MVCRCGAASALARGRTAPQRRRRCSGPTTLAPLARLYLGSGTLAHVAAPRPQDIWPEEPPPWGAAWRSHWRVAGESLGYVASRPGYTLLAWTVIAVAIALPGSLYLLDANLRRAAGGWAGSAGFSVYFSPQAEPDASAALARRLAAAPEVARVRLITPAEALAELRGRVAGAGSALIGLDAEALPATVRATLAADVPEARRQALAARMAEAEGVEEVVVESVWLERLAAIRQLVQRLEWLAAGMFGLGVVLVCSASVRLAVESRLAELRVLALVGASRRYVRRPFLYLGAFYGGGGGLLAAMVVAAGLVWLDAPLRRLFESYGATLEVAGFDAKFVSALMASGMALGILGAVFAVRGRLRELAVVS